MTILFARNIEKNFGDRTIFTVQSLEIQGNDRIDIVGVNGARKSTLLQILSTEIEPDEGSVSHYGSIAIIPQFSEKTLEDTSTFAKRKWNISNVSDAMSCGERMRLKIAHALEQEASIYESNRTSFCKHYRARTVTIANKINRNHQPDFDA